MGACCHMEGVQCDNCRTGLSAPLNPETITLTPWTPDPLDQPATKRDLDELRAELEAWKVWLVERLLDVKA